MLRQRFNDGWQHRPKVSRFLEMTGSGREWVPVRLPHDAMIERSRDGADATLAPVAYFVPGADEYRRQLAVPEAWHGKRVILEFEGVYRDAMVYVDEVLVAARPSGYTEFAVAIDPYLRPGADHVVRVESRTYEDSRWYSGAGIHRNVNLVVADLLHVALDGIRVDTDSVSPDHTVVVVEVEVVNDSESTRRFRVNTDLLDDEGRVLVEDDVPVTVLPHEQVVVRHRLLVRRPRRWSPEDPYLHHCRTTLVESGRDVDEARTTFGIRTLSLDSERGLCVNEQPVKLRGACVHHDNGVIGAAAIDRADERRVALLHDAGFNALRSAHQPMSRAMLDACDRHGILVVDEAFDAWTAHKVGDDYASDFSEWWAADVEAMVRKDRNHPSVVLYSIGNEIPEVAAPLGAAWARRIAEKIRSLDPSRFTTIATNPLLLLLDDLDRFIQDAEPVSDTGINTAMSWFDGVVPRIVASEEAARRMEESFAAVDVAGYNYAASCYVPDRMRFPHRAVLGTETCPPSIDENWALVSAHGHVLGDFTWTGWDYLGEVGVGRVEHGAVDERSSPGSFMGPYPWLTAWVGDLDITGCRRPVSYWREIVFGLHRGPYIAVQRPEHHGQPIRHASPWACTDAVASWSWSGFEGAPVRVEVYADADEIELLLDGRSLGTAPAGAEHRYRALFDVQYRPGTLEAVARSGTVEVGRHALMTASGDLRLRLASDRTEIAAGDSDLAFIDLAIVDSAGNVATDRDRLVTIDLEGPGHLQGFGSANPCTEETFAGTRHTTFNGRAQVVLRPDGPGEVTLTARAEGAMEARQQVTVLAKAPAVGSPRPSVVPRGSEHGVPTEGSPSRSTGSR